MTYAHILGFHLARHVQSAESKPAYDPVYLLF